MVRTRTEYYDSLLEKTGLTQSELRLLICALMLSASIKPIIAIENKRYGDAVIKPEDVQSIVAHRTRQKAEEYLVQWQWKGSSKFTPYSWHPIHELAGADGLDDSSADSCLHHVQLYLESLKQQASPTSSKQTLKRKTLDLDHVSRLSPLGRNRESLSSVQSGASLETRDDWDAYNCEAKVSNGTINIEPMTRLRVDTSGFPTESMRHRSMNSRYNIAANKIRSQFVRNLRAIPGKPIKLVNTRDASTPPLSFTFIDEYLYRDGVEPPDIAMMQGCGLVSSEFGQTCRPNMGGDCGCEYTRSCECLEYAKIDEKRMEVHEIKVLRAHERGLFISLVGLPKRFPYSKKTGLLVTKYLGQRWPIYECNDNCACGPGCKSRVVQKGRTVELEVFRTRNRGWGLRAREHLWQGQFIDTYRGEVITRSEADRRAESGGKGKDSYLFSLDKFMPDGDHLYEIDGEFFGGPSRFINHSCDPNCVVYVVSRDKNNSFLYEIAFFTLREVEAGEELTFDYRDSDGTDEVLSSVGEREGTDERVEEDSIPCLCGASNCRKWLWK